MTQERFTQLPTVGTSELTDIICAVQGFVSEPSQLGLSTQQTLSQIYNLFKSTLILFNAGNPNGVVTGTPYQLCWDTVNNILYVCTAVGTVWAKSIQLTAGTGITITQDLDDIVISSTAAGISWNQVTTNTVMMSENGYQVNTGSSVNLALPTTSDFGDEINIMGFGGGLWTITQGTGQQINIGSSASTLGVGGSVSATNRNDSVVLICQQANTIWSCLGGPQGNLSII